MRTFLIFALIAFIVSSCATEKPGNTTSSTPAASVSSGSAKDPTDAIQTITESREIARAAAQNLALDLKGKPELNNAARRYNAAMAKNMGYVNAVVYAVKFNNPLNTAKFRQTAKDCAASTKEFTDYAENTTSKPSLGNKKFAIASVGALVDALVTAGTKIYDAYSKRSQDARNERAEWIKKELAWPTWSEATKAAG